MGAETQQFTQPSQEFDQRSATPQQQAAPTGLWGPQAPSGQPYANIEETQMHYGPAPPQPTAASPAPIAQGYSMGPINTTQPMYCPAQQVATETTDTAVL